MRRPRVFQVGDQWGVLFSLDGRRTLWKTKKHADALTFALNLAALAGRGLRRD